MNTADLLRTIADVKDENEGEWWREFQHKHFDTLGWITYENWSYLLTDVVTHPHLVRHCPRTIKVSGDISEAVVNDARKALENLAHNTLAYRCARALMDLIEQPVEEE